MRESTKAALGGIIASLSVVIMLITYISPVLVYTAPAFAGILLIVIVTEMGYGWAIGTYAVISILSVFFVADKEAAVFFIMIFGYYPILSELLQLKVKSLFLKIPIKLFIFNASLAMAVFICSFVFSIDYSEFSEYGKTVLLLILLLMNVMFLIYDTLINRIRILYHVKIRKKLLKILKH